MPSEWPTCGAPNKNAQAKADAIYHGTEKANPLVSDPCLPDGEWNEPKVLHQAKRNFDIEDFLPNVREFDTSVSEVFLQAEELLIRKHKDYGPKNISDAPGGALNGLRVRMHDKMARINNLIDSGAEPENESLRDSFIDLLNYSAIAILVLNGEWPGTE